LAHEPARSFIPLREYFPLRHEHLLDFLQLVAFMVLQRRRRPRYAASLESVLFHDFMSISEPMSVKPSCCFDSMMLLSFDS
jgi:hypothetical protein